MSDQPNSQTGGVDIANLIERAQHAPTAHERAAVVNLIETYHRGQDTALPGSPPAESGSAQPAQDLDSRIAAAMTKARDAPTGTARKAAVDELEALHSAKAGQTAGADEAAVDLAPQSAAAYDLKPPVGMTITNEEAAGEMKTALFEAGVPAEFAGHAFKNASSLYANGILSSPESYQAALLTCHGALRKQYGESAEAVIRNGSAFLDQLAKRDPRLAEAAQLASADPWSVATAASMVR